LATKRSGMPRATSEGKYWRNSPHNGHVTTIDLNGNSGTPAGTLRRQRLQSTTNRFRPRSGSKNPMEGI
jgi:hypothetical protein